MRRGPASEAEGEHEFLDTSGTLCCFMLGAHADPPPVRISHSNADQDKVIADLRRQNAKSAGVYSVNPPPALLHQSHMASTVRARLVRSRPLPFCVLPPSPTFLAFSIPHALLRL